MLYIDNRSSERSFCLGFIDSHIGFWRLVGLPAASSFSIMSPIFVVAKTTGDSF